MKKNIITFLAALAILASCDYNDKFEGLETADQPKNVANYEIEYTKTFAADKSIEEIRKTISTWLMSQYFTADKGSYARVAFHQEMNNPEYISAIDSASIYTLTLSDYQMVWGESSDRNFFTPQKPAQDFVPAMLAKVYPEAVNGQVKVITYNQANAEPTGILPDIYPVNALYQYSENEWNIYTNNVKTLMLGKADFEKMGSENDYFNQEMNPDHYLPIYLGLSYPYAKEGDQMVMVYKWYEDSKMMVRANLYVFAENWGKAATVRTLTEKYTFVGNGKGWIFDPVTPEDK